MSLPLFPGIKLPPDLVLDIHGQNPWWHGDPLPRIPEFRRWPFDLILKRLYQPLAPILAIRGPRQIGKTTLQLQVISELLRSGVDPRRILRIQFDELPALSRRKFSEEPVLRIVDWYEEVVLRRTLNAAAHEGQPAYLFFDEIQNLKAWSIQLKSLVDHHTVSVLVTGSSALRIEQGQDSLAGRIQSLDVGPLRLAEIAGLRGFGNLQPAGSENGWLDWLVPDFWRSLRQSAADQAAVLDQAFAAFSERGAYPFAHNRADVTWPEVADHLITVVVRRVIQHDLRLGDRGRKRDAGLLEAVFRMACRYAGQAPGPGLMAREAGHLQIAHVGPARILHYLQFLDSSLLLRTVSPLEIRLKKRRAPDKLCLSDHAIRAAWLQEAVPLTPDELDGQPQHALIAGHVAESIVGYYLASLTGLDVAWWPARDVQPEVDFVVVIGDRRIPVEVKYQASIDRIRDTDGLRWFLDKAVNNAAFGLLVTRDHGITVDDPRIICLPLKALLLAR